jgi:enterochelin esterase family protein
MANVLDNLIEARQTRPIIGVFIPPDADRAGEYRLAKVSQFTTMIVKELVPYIDSVYRTDARASERGTMGSSDGGHIALYLAVNYSGTFGLAGGQSSTITDLIREPVRTGPKIPVKFYLDVGTYDIYSTNYRFLELNREFRNLLLSKGYVVTYAEYHEGHSWGNWRAHTSNILRTLFPYTSTDVKARKGARKNVLLK